MDGFMYVRFFICVLFGKVFHSNLYLALYGVAMFQYAPWRDTYMATVK